jgi:hypothetical protein
MIATGNHNFERFAALCNTPGGSQGEVAAADSMQCTRLFRKLRVAKLATPTNGGAKSGAFSIQRSTTPPPHVRSAPFNSGMIATGNHNFERFAALCNTLPGEARALCATDFPFHKEVLL